MFWLFLFLTPDRVSGYLAFCKQVIVTSCPVCSLLLSCPLIGASVIYSLAELPPLAPSSSLLRTLFLGLTLKAGLPQSFVFNLL